MFKKLISMATAVLLMASGISFVSATSAIAACSGFGVQNPAGTFSSITSTSVSVDFTNLTSNCTDQATSWDLQIRRITPSPVTLISTSTLTSSSPTYVATNLSPGSLYNFFLARVGTSNGPAAGINVTTLADSPAPAPAQTAEQIAEAAAAQARAAEAAAAAVRAAEIATAQTALATVLRGDKAGTQAEYRAANINITTTAALSRLNAEVLKLSAVDRADFAKIKALADKIEFDETFFSAAARPSAAAYSSYGVVGVTDRILSTINAKVLELPVALRADIKAIQELVKVESFVDRVANTATRSTVSAAALVSRGLLVAEYPRRHSVVQGLASYPEGSLNTMAKIEAAIKEQIAKAEAPKRRLAEIKAKIAARNK